MSGRSRPKRRAKGDYAVGYCRPPVQHQVKKGQVLNPRGRPKGSRSFWDDFEEALFAQRTITDGDGRKRKATHQQILFKVMFQQALGERDKRSQLALVQLALQFATQLAPDVELPPLNEDEEKLLNAFIRRRAGEIGDE